MPIAHLEAARLATGQTKVTHSDHARSARLLSDTLAEDLRDGARCPFAEFWRAYQKQKSKVVLVGTSQRHPIKNCGNKSGKL